MSDQAIHEELGRRFKLQRQNQGLSEIELATRAGISRTALRNAESGSDVTLSTLIKIMRALALLDQLDAFMPDPGPSPLMLARRRRSAE